MAKCRKKAFFTQIFSNCSRVKNRAENRAQPKTLLNYKNRHSRRSKHKILQNTERRQFFTHKYFQIGTCEQPLHTVNLKKTYFYKGNTLSKRLRDQVPRAQIQVCASTKQSSWPGGEAICDFWPCLLLPHFSSEMPIFIVRKGAVPEPAFRWTPNRPVF